MRITLVHNLDAGTGGPSKDDLLSALREAGHKVVYRSADEKDALEALDHAGDLVVVAGGDGTVGQVAKRLAGRGVPIAVVPVGTANNIASALGAGGDVRSQAAAWATADRRPFDVGRAVGPVGPEGEKLFLESVGGGLFATLIAALDEEKHRGKQPQFGTTEEAMEYAVGELRRLLRGAEADEWKLDLDGVDHSGRYLLVEAMNICCVGPNLVAAPDADFGDGLLDVVLLGEADRGGFDDFLRRRLTNPRLSPELPVTRARNVIFLARGDAPIHVDDKTLDRAHEGGKTSGPLRLYLDRGALNFVLP